MKRLFAFLTALFIKAPIALYRAALSPLLGPRCRFYPSCSAYALEAVDRHGAIKGLGLAVQRLLRCHPLSGAKDFHDPVPPATTKKTNIKKVTL